MIAISECAQTMLRPLSSFVWLKRFVGAKFGLVVIRNIASRCYMIEKDHLTELLNFSIGEDVVTKKT